MTQPTDRPGIEDLTSDRLDQLYDELWHLRLAQAGADLALQAACRMTDEQRARAEQAEADLARYDEVQGEMNENAINLTRALARAEVTLAAVSAECDRIESAVRSTPTATDLTGGYLACLCHIRAVLDQHGQTPKETT
ncbi:hypothetical protein [Streptomyces zaomyceticus]|uniref:hypothetical protein n=1 Tax=Streptomyces zaomyceticus TaxID=68286 RepID=UPI0037A9175C